MARQTSIESYHAIKEEGLLAKRSFEVYAFLFENGPCSGRDIYRSLCPGNNINPSAYLPRLAELRDKGIIEEVGFKIDPDTKRRVILWDVNGRMPIKLEKPKKTKCPHCEGKGYFLEQQTRML